MTYPDHTLVVADHNGRPVALDDDMRSRHLHIIGQTGTGKSNLLLAMLAHDLAAGHGVALLDPHGDLARAALEFLPPHRTKDLAYFNPSDIDRPFGFNVMENPTPDTAAGITDNIVAAFIHIWGETSIGARSQQVLRNCLRALMDTPQTTLLCIPKLLNDARYRERILSRVTDPMVRAYWRDQYASYGRDLPEIIGPIQNKLDAILSVPAFRNIVGQYRTSFDLRRYMDEGRVLIVNLSPGAKPAFGEGSLQLLGSFITSAIARTAMSRADLPPDLRRPFRFYADEFQHFATDSFASILSESRKFGLQMTLAHQFLGQLPPSLSDAVRGNAANVVAFRLGADDAKVMAPQIGLLEPSALVDEPSYKAWARLLQNGVPTSALNIAIYPSPSPINRRPRRAIEHSRERFGRRRRTIEQSIERFLEPGIA